MTFVEKGSGKTHETSRAAFCHTGLLKTGNVSIPIMLKKNRRQGIVNSPA